MQSPQPVYLPTNCDTAYQLNWSLSVFGKVRLPNPDATIEQLQIAVALDNLKILEFKHREPNVVQFFLSSRPQYSPAQLIRSIKGRWQHLLRESSPIEFRRNYRITSVGDAKHDNLDAYVARQTSKHPMADNRVQSMLE